MTAPVSPAARQRRLWSGFVLGVGLVLAGLCALTPSPTAFGVALVLMLAGLLGLLLGRP